MSPHDVRLVRIAVATAAFATLAYELSLTRIFSVLFRSPFVFLILSIAVCGLGLGAVLAAILDSRGDADRTDPARYLGWPLLAFGLLLPVPLVLLLTVAQGLVADARGALVAVLTAAPYLAAGLFMSRAFRRHALDAGRLYFFDLCGAGLAALASVPILTRVGGLAMPLLLGALVLLVALPLLRGRRVAQAVAAAALVACVAATMAQVRSGWLSLPAVTSTDSTIAKPLFQELGDPAAGAKVLYTEWSAVARTDVVSNTGTETLFIWTDGDVPTQMEPFSGNLEDMASARGFIGYVPFGLRPSPERVLCIGPGGGLDVLLALLGDAKSIEAVELNPAMQNVVDRYRDFYGDLYQRPELGPGLIIDEGRSYMQRSTRQFDVIYFALAKSATTQQGGMALVDNYLYTEEAFDAYWSRLSDNGLLALVFQNPALTDRCLATMASALMKAGLSGDDIAERIAYMNISPEVFASTPYQFLLLLSKRPFSDDERDVLKLLGTGYQLRYAPGVAEFPPYANVRGVSSGTEYAAALAARSDYLTRVEEGGPLVRLDLSPVTDDQPFYADLAPGLNPMLRPILNFSLWAGLLVILGALAWVAWGGGVLRPESRVAERLRGGVAPVAYFAGFGRRVHAGRGGVDPEASPGPRLPDVVADGHLVHAAGRWLVGRAAGEPRHPRSGNGSAGLAGATGRGLPGGAGAAGTGGGGDGPRCAGGRAGRRRGRGGAAAGPADGPTLPQRAALARRARGQLGADGLGGERGAVGDRLGVGRGRGVDRWLSLCDVRRRGYVPGDLRRRLVVGSGQ